MKWNKNSLILFVDLIELSSFSLEGFNKGMDDLGLTNALRGLGYPSLIPSP